jgi:oxygen-independent coproporphyrinogen-3 oxidase
VDLGEICAAFGLDGEETFALELLELREPEEAGLVRRRGLTLSLTPLGHVLVRNVAMVFDPYLRRRAAATTQTFSKTI